jgi:hypothetical protein
MYSYSVPYIFAAVCLWTKVADSAVAVSGNNIDHLVPVGQMVDATYQSLLARKLYLTPADYARIVVIPSGSSSGETALSLYSKQENDDKVILTSTKGDRDLWSAASDLDPMLRKDPRIKVRRLDVPFPKPLAILISKALKRLIEESREPESTDRMVLHGTHILYIVDPPGDRLLKARLTPESKGKTTGALRKLTDLLREYCHATVEKRKALEKKMKTEVQRLTD